MVAGPRHQSFFAFNHFRTLQPSEFVILLVKVYLDFVPYSEFLVDTPGSDRSILSEKRRLDERPLPSAARVLPPFIACFRKSKIDQREHKYISEQRDDAALRPRGSTRHPF